MYIGLAESKFLEVRRIFAQIFPNYSEKFCGTFPTKSLYKDQRSWRPFYGM